MVLDLNMSLINVPSQIWADYFLMSANTKTAVNKVLVFAPPRWHSVHCSAEATPHLPSLVPPHHCAALLLVLLQGPGGRRWLVHDHELHRPLPHVLLLCGTGSWPAGAPPLCHVHHGLTDPADDDGAGRGGPGVSLDARRALPFIRGQHHLGLAHVLQLPSSVCHFLLRLLP